MLSTRLQNRISKREREHETTIIHIGLDSGFLCDFEGGDALGQVTQRCCGCSIPGDVQGQVGWVPVHPDLVAWNPMGFEVPSNSANPVIL